MITVYALEGCKKCKQLTTLLDNELIEYNLYHEEDNIELYDKLEYIVQCYNYPIIELYYRHNILYITDNTSTSTESYVIKYNNIEEAFKLIKQYI
jgi:glutaredoxin